MDPAVIFQPFFATLLLTLVVWFYMYGRRLPFIFASGLDPKLMTPQELATRSPPGVSNPSDNLKNLFELPTLFYAVVLYLYVTRQVDTAYVVAAWGFFAFRLLHSLVHCTFNLIPLQILAVRDLGGRALVHGDPGGHRGVLLMHASARQLVFHGAVVLLVGLLCGAPYGRAINRGAPASLIAAWRLAHGSLPMGAAIMLAIAGVLSALTATDAVRWIIAVSLIVSSYAFCLSLPLAAAVGHRGLSFGGPSVAKLVAAGNLIGAIGSLIAAAALIYAGWLSL